MTTPYEMPANIADTLERVRSAPGLASPEEINTALAFYREAQKYADIVSDIHCGGDRYGTPNVIRGQIDKMEWYVGFNNQRYGRDD